MSQNNQQLLLTEYISEGYKEFTTNGTDTFIVPIGVKYICAGGIGAGGGAGGQSAATVIGSGGGGGGALAYSNYIPVTPGETLNIVRGTPGSAAAGGYSQVDRGGTVLIKAAGGSAASSVSNYGGAGGSTANSTGDTKFAGGSGGAGSQTLPTNQILGGGGGGAAGFASAGGGPSSSSTSGGGGGGSGIAGTAESGISGAGGGGSNFGSQSTGAAGSSAGGSAPTGGGGGSGGSSGGSGYFNVSGTWDSSGGNGGSYGGGAGGSTNSSGTNAAVAGGVGKVIICWGRGRKLPSNFAAALPNIAVVGSNSANSNTVSVTAHSIGDYIFICAFNAGSTTVPSLPYGYTNIGTRAGTACAARLGYKIATSTSDASGTWTNATTCSSIVLSGVTGYAFSASGTLATGSITYPALNSGNAFTPQNNRILLFGATKSITSSIETPPENFGLKTTLLGGTYETACFLSVSNVAKFADLTQVIGGGSVSCVAFSLEVKGH